MAQYFAFTFDGKNYEARCTSRNTRNGFAHDCTVRDENYNDITEATCYYLNRTWECYRFESVLHSAIYKMAEEEAEEAVALWKKVYGKSRISKAMRAKVTALAWEAKENAYNTIKAL